MNCRAIKSVPHGRRNSNGALPVAARFFDRSIDTKTFKRGMDAYRHPDFYRQLRKDPESCVKRPGIAGNEIRAIEPASSLSA